MAGETRNSGARKRQLRSAARLYAVQALFQMEAASISLKDVETEFEAHRIGCTIDEEVYPEADRRHFRDLLQASVAHQARIDQLTDRALAINWPIDRIDPILRAVFRAAGAEIVALETPPRVAINEYVDVAKAFFPAGNETKFVNAVLDHMAREAQPGAFER